MHLSSQAIWKVEIWRSTLPGQFRQKKSENPILMKKENLGAVTGTCHPSNDGKFKISVSWSRMIWAKSKTPISKIIRAKKVGGLAQAIEPHCLASVKP
jgi:hypothetical protein